MNYKITLKIKYYFWENLLYSIINTNYLEEIINKYIQNDLFDLILLNSSFRNEIGIYKTIELTLDQKLITKLDKKAKMFNITKSLLINLMLSNEIE